MQHPDVHPASLEEKMEEIGASTSALGKQYLDSLRKEKVETPVLFDRDVTGNSLLDNVHALIEELRAQGERPETISAIVEEFLERKFEPGSATQDQHGTCAAESAKFLFSYHNPGEWARVLRELICFGESTVAGGAVIRVPRDLGKRDRSAAREYTDAVAQAALMNLAAYEGEEYSNKRDGFTRNKGLQKQRFEGGLTTEQSQYVFEQLTGRAYTGIEDKNTLIALVKRYGHYLPVALEWEGEGAHQVVVTRYDEKTSRVYFRNPHGPDFGPDVVDGATERQNPPRRVEQGDIGEESMTIEDFREHVLSAELPQEDLLAFKQGVNVDGPRVEFGESRTEKNDPAVAGNISAFRTRLGGIDGFRSDSAFAA
ncbi:hypothetical protein HYW84_02775 [Candidatus Peregrinibacteria bacterium]|nr:hypothetical protein [Candidatus Peregrinibacteria bacterium]